MEKTKASMRLKIIRESLGLSRETVAEKLNVTPQIVANMELGRKKIYADDLAKLSKIFGMTADQFLGNGIEIRRKLNLNENELIDIFRSVSESAQELIINICKDIVEFEESEEPELSEPKFLKAASGGENATDEEIEEAVEIAKNL